MSRITFESESSSARPISEKKLCANRQNAQKSTGPRTPHGKSKVARNAVKHNCSQSALLPSECDATYEIHQAEIYESLRPKSPIQYALVSQISQILWKLDRFPDTDRHLYDMNSEENEIPCPTLARNFTQNPTTNHFLLF